MNWQIRYCTFRCKRCTPTPTLIQGDLATVLAIFQQSLATPMYLAFVTPLVLMAHIP
jgi:hypothetical protein